jgi:nicotinic acid mononucleotide adenylyltransferase
MDRKEVKKKKKKFSEHDPEKYINLEPTTNDSYFREATGTTVVLSFGRFNPITVGHEKLVNKVISEALRRKATPMVFMSHSQDTKKNPLSYEDKINYGRKAFGRAVIKSKSRTIIEVAKELSGKFDNLVIVVGQDRVKEFEDLLNKYNGKEFNFNSIEVVSAGARDPDAEGVEGMSASKMRSIAQEGNFEEFQKGLPRKLKSSAREIYNTVRAGMNLSEEHLEERAQLNVAQRRRRGLVMKRYKTKIAAARRRARRRRASPEKLKLRAQRRALEVIRQRLSKNKSYKEMSPTEKIALDKRLARVPQTVLNRIATRQLPAVKRAETERLAKALSPKTEDLNLAFENYMFEKEDPDVGHRKGSQPKDYYKGVAKSVKDDRARHFEKYSKMNDDNPAAYKKAPGDEGAKTKTSKHTKRFKQIFGEALQEASHADMRVRKRPHMAMEKNGSVKFDKRFKIYKSKQEINESAEEINEELVNLILDLDNFVMSEEFDALMEANPKEALKKKSEKSGISYGILKKVFDRGVAAWRTGHRPGTTPTQWGLARTNSFATKGKGTWGKADSDLAAKVRKEENYLTLDDLSELTRIDESDTLVKVLEKMHKYVIQGIDPGQIAADIANLVSGIGSGRQLEKAYIDSYGLPKKKSSISGSALKKKYGFKAEGAETAKAKLRISQEKTADARKHDRMLDAAKLRDKAAKKSLSKSLREGDPNPAKREYGTDSLLKILKGDTPGESKNVKESSPLMKDLPRGARVRFTYKTINEPDQNLEGTVVGTETYSHEGSSDVVSSRGRLRIRDDEGRLYIVKHEDVERVK